MFTEIQLNDFRILKNQSLKLGKYITMLAGWNATGKSTVLALLANSTQRTDKKTYTGKPFRAEFSEILKGSKNFDKSEANRLQITWENGTQQIIKTFRTSWQNENGKNRFRVIPKELDEDDKRKNEAKFDIPVIYLGLSRLFPIGESDDESLKGSALNFQEEEDKNWFIKTYQQTLSLQNETITGITGINVSIIKKNTSGINTQSYDWRTNSSGQDNLSQILFALLSFKKLKQSNKDYKGGLLIIDEIESSLHPKAQQHLIDLLIKEARANDIQIVFTTHSLSIIKYFSDKHKSDDGNITYYYFTKANDKLEIQKTPSFEKMEQDLLLPVYHKPSPQQIVVYTEDPEARWFLSKLLRYRIPQKRLNLLDIRLSCSSIIDLMNTDPAFANYIVILDGDLPTKQENRIKKNKGNLLLLPTNLNEDSIPKKESPEECLYNFIFSPKATDYLAKEHEKNDMVKIEYFRENAISSDNREEYKKWFNSQKEILDNSQIWKYWKEVNSNQVSEFIQKFQEKFNKIADKLNIEKI